MPRALWNGAISFGLVNIPVRLHTAVQSRTVRFHQLDSKTGSRVRYKKVAEVDESVEVSQSDIVKGYETSPGQYVLITPEELEALDPKASRTIEIEAFVDLDEIDPVFYDHPYQVGPGAEAAKPYKLLVEAMEAANKVAIARFVMRSKQYLCAIRVKDGALLLSTMHYADEIVPDAVGELDGLADVEVSDKERKMAEQLIASLSDDFEPEQYRDTYREKVEELIAQKAAGETITVGGTEEEPTTVLDLMAALEASVAEAKAARRSESARQPA